MSAIDTSYWNGHPIFGQVRAAGVTLVIMKCGGGEGGRLYGDSVYVANREAARAVGLAVGSYFFNGPVDPSAAADMQMRIVDWRPGDVVAIDIENNGNQRHWTPAEAMIWVQRILAHGVPADRIFVYMSAGLLGLGWDAIAALGVRVWVAQYGPNDGAMHSTPGSGPWSGYTLWQWTSVASCPGIVGNVDMNVISSLWASAGETPITSIPTPPPYLAPQEDDMFRLYYRQDAPTAASPSGTTYALGALDPSWQTPGHNFWFEATAESRRDWRELFGYLGVDGLRRPYPVDVDIWNARSNDPNRISDVSKYVPLVNAPAQVVNVTAAPLSDVDVQRIAAAVLASEAPSLRDLATAAAGSPTTLANAILEALKAKL